DPNTPVDFCSLNLEDVAALLGGRADMHGNVWFPDPDSDGDYAKCRVSKAPGEPYGVDLTVDGDKQRILDYLVEVLGISEKSRKLTKVEKLAQKAEIERRKTLKQAEHAYNVGKAKAEHWDGPGFNSYDDGDGVPGKINCPAQPVTDGGPECVLKYWDSRKLARPDPRVFKYKPAFYATLTDKRKNSRKELIEPAHIVALTYNALTGAIEGLHYTYVDDEGNGIAHQWKNENKPHRK